MGENPSREAAAVVHAAWVRFVTDLDPGWARYRTGTRTTMVFGPRTGAVDHPDAPVLALWGVG